MQTFLQFVIHHWFLWTMLVVVLGLIAWAELNSNAAGSRAVTPSNAVNLMNHEQAVVIDIRNKEAYKSGHVLGAIHLPATEFSQKWSKLNESKDKPIIVVCAQGMQAQKIAKELKAKSFEKVYHLQGGMSAWRGAGLPISQK